MEAFKQPSLPSIGSILFANLLLAVIYLTLFSLYLDCGADMRKMFNAYLSIVACKSPPVQKRKDKKFTLLLQVVSLEERQHL